MQDAPIPVTLVLGFSAAAKTALLRVLQSLQTTEASWGWMLQDLSAEFEEPGLGRPGSRLRLSSACICCLGQAELQAQLPRLLRAGPWKRVVIELASGSHPAKVLDFLRSKSWSTKLDVQQVLLAIDSETLSGYFSGLEPKAIEGSSSTSAPISAIAASNKASMNASAGRILARAQLLASTHLVAIKLSEHELATMRGSLSKCDLLEDLVCLSADDFTHGALVAPGFSNSTSANQDSRAHISCNLRTDESNTLCFDLRWSPSRLFNRKRVMAVINTFAPSERVLFALGVFATERAWYEWRLADSGFQWSDTDYRAGSFLRLKTIDSIVLREQLRELQFAIEDTIEN